MRLNRSRNRKKNCRDVSKEMDWEFEISRCNLLHRECINNVLLYSIGNYIQLLVINHNGKGYEKQCVCMYVCMHTELLGRTGEILPRTCSINFIYIYKTKSLRCIAEINKHSKSTLLE